MFNPRPLETSPEIPYVFNSIPLTFLAIEDIQVMTVANNLGNNMVSIHQYALKKRDVNLVNNKGYPIEKLV